MRRLLLVLAVSACTHSAATGPAWPKLHATDNDGGESLAPRDPAKEVVVATDDSDSDDKPAPAEAPAAQPEAAQATEGGTSTTAPAAQSEDVMQTDEIVIDVGPDD
jgi:hypothetical protein